MSAVVPLNSSSDTVTEAPALRAFVIDDETRAAVAAVAAVRKPEAEIFDGGIPAAMSILSQNATPSHVLIDISEAEDPTAALRSLLTVCPPDSCIIALGTINDVPFCRSLLEAGAADYLLKPLEPEALRQSLDKLARNAAGSDAESKSLHSIGIVGARGGVGASTIAVNMAWHVANEMGRQCALVDLDVQFGTVALALDLEPCHGMREIMQNPERVDSLFISSSMVRESENLMVLGTEEPFENELTVSPVAIGMLLDGMDSAVEYVFFDLPRTVLVGNPGLVRRLDSVILVAEPSLASVRDTTRLAELIRSTAPDIQIIVVANKVGANKKGELPIAEFKRNIQMPIEYTIPWDAKTPAEAASAGKPFAAIASRSPIVNAINGLSDGVTAAEPKEAPLRGLAKWLRKS